MTMLDSIRKPVETEMQKYEDFLRSSISSSHRMTGSMLDYIFNTRGKAIRPLITVLSAALCSETKDLPQSTRIGAMFVEMMHTASLVHDDVIDEAFMRRGKPSVKALWRSHRAVLIGDYILAKSYALGMESGCYDIVECVVKAMGDLCEGELLQNDQSDRLEMDRALYEEIIFKKTASLIGASSQVGAISVGKDSATAAKLRSFGDKLGMGFQIKDDILDFQADSETGKPQHGDLKERKITLPLLTVLEKSDSKQRKEIIALLSDIRNKPENAVSLAAIVERNNGIPMASDIMHSYIDDAKKELDFFPDSIYKDSLRKLCDFVAGRNY